MSSSSSVSKIVSVSKAKDFVEGGLSFILGSAAGVLNSNVAIAITGKGFGYSISSSDISVVGMAAHGPEIFITAILEAGLLFTILGMVAPKLTPGQAFFFTVGCLDGSTISSHLGQGLGGMIWSKV